MAGRQRGLGNMGEEFEPEDYARLIRIMRRIAKEEAEQAIDEHLCDYAHNEQPIEEAGQQ